MTGVVKWFNDRKGYGFVSGENKDYFVHRSSIVMDGYKILKEGQVVDFDTKKVRKGIEAIRVSVKERP